MKKASGPRPPPAPARAGLESALASATTLEPKVDALNALAYEVRNRDPPRSKACAEEAWRLARSAGYTRGIAWGNLLRGFYRTAAGRYVDAITCQREALAAFKKLADARGEALALRLVGGIYVRLLELRKALGYYRGALAIFERLGDGPETLVTLANTATILLDLGDAAGALERLERGAKQARALGNREVEMQCRLGAGIACRQLGRPGASIVHYKAAHRIAAGERNGRREAEALILIGEHHLIRRRPRAAVPCYARALALGRATENLVNQVNAAHGLGEAALLAGAPEQAERWFSAAIRLGRRAGNPDGKILGLIGLSGVRLAQDRRGEALRLAREALALAQAGQCADYVAAAQARLAAARP